MTATALPIDQILAALDSAIRAAREREEPPADDVELDGDVAA